MSSEVTVNLSKALNWPNRCARCGSKHQLRAAHLQLGEILDSRLKLDGAIQFKTRVTTLRYPVCSRHFSGLGFTALLTRQTAVMKIARAFIWVLGILGILPALALPFTLRHSPLDSPPLGLLAISALFPVLMLCLIWARRAQPVQGVRADNNEVTLRFTDPGYRAAFQRANR